MSGPADGTGRHGAGAAVTRSEEQLRVGVVRVPRERVRIRREVVSEDVTLTVTVQREVLRVDSEVLDEDTGSDTGSGTAGVDAATPAARSFEIVLRREEPVVSLRVVPVERVRVDVETVTEDVAVSDEVRREVVEVEDPLTGGRHRP